VVLRQTPPAIPVQGSEDQVPSDRSVPTSTPDKCSTSSSCNSPVRKAERRSTSTSTHAAVPRVREVSEVKRAPQVHKVQPAQRVHKAPQVQVHRVHQGRKVRRGWRGRQVPPGQQGRQAHKDQQGHKGRRGRQQSSVFQRGTTSNGAGLQGNSATRGTTHSSRSSSSKSHHHHHKGEE